MLPYTSKFYANGTIFDSVGDVGSSYISSYVDGDVIYFLRNTSGEVDAYNTHSEEIVATRAIAAVGVESVSAIVHKKGVVYGFDGYNVKPFDDESVIYLKDENKLIQERYDFTNRVTLLSSATVIKDFIVHKSDYIVLHNDATISKFNHARILQYTFTVTASSPSLTGIMSSDASPQLISIDVVREYTDQGLKEYPIVMGSINTGQLFFAKIDQSTQSLYDAKMIDAQGEYLPVSSSKHVNYNLTNYSYLVRTHSGDKNTLTFKITLKNTYNNRDTRDVSIPVDVSVFTTGYHHFAFKLDTVRGEVALMVDGRSYARVSIPSVDYTFQDITYESLCVGATYFANNVPLFKKLKQPNYYMTDNCKLKQFKVYDKALTDEEMRMLTYKNTKINDMVASFPCGQRNEVDQIERLFSFNVPGSKSNSVNIVIKNSELVDAALQERVKAAVVERIKKVLPVTTVINEVRFKQSVPDFAARIET